MKRATSLLRALSLLFELASAQRFALLFGLILLMSASAPGQSSSSQSSPGQMTVYFPSATRPQTRMMTVDEVIKLSKAGLSDDVIIQQIKKKGQRFDLSADQLIQLKSASVSERVIQVMIDPAKDPSPSPAEKKTGAPTPQQARQLSGQDSPSSGLPTEISSTLLPAQLTNMLQSLSDGFYYKTSQGWQKLEPISMAGGGLKHVGKMFVPGLTPQMVYTFRDAESPAQLADKRPTFCIKQMPSLADVSGRSGRDLLIVRFDKKKDHRELQISNGGNMFTFKAGLSKDRMPDITIKTIADGIFIVTPNEDLRAGEYMVTFSALGISGYDFGVKR